MSRVIDTFINMPVPADKQLIERTEVTKRLFGRGDRASRAFVEGSTVDDLIADMDAAGVDHGLLVARHGWSHPETRPVGPLATSHGVSDEIFDEFCAEAAAAVEAHPGRLSGTVMLDPMGAMMAVRQLERAVTDHGFVAARLMPAATGVPVDHPLCYPLYTKCVELGIPMTVNLGLPGPLRSGQLQRPILIEHVLLAYPELIVVASHIGHPWHLETLALLQKFPNFFLTTAGWSPKYVPAELVHFLNTRGAHKLMWGSDYPLLSVERALADVDHLQLEPDRRDGYLYDNAARVFGL